MIIHVKTFMNSADSIRRELDLPPDATVKDALQKLDLLDHLEVQEEQLIFLVNSATAELSQALEAGDQLLILQSMMGG